jgi:hypothetical protein
MPCLAPLRKRLGFALCRMAGIHRGRVKIPLQNRAIHPISVARCTCLNVRFGVLAGLPG